MHIHILKPKEMTTKELNKKLGHGWFQPEDFRSLPPGEYIIYNYDGADVNIIPVVDIVEAEHQGKNLYIREKLDFEDPKDEEEAEEEDKYREHLLDKWQARGAITLTIEPADQRVYDEDEDPDNFGFTNLAP